MPSTGAARSESGSIGALQRVKRTFRKSLYGAKMGVGPGDLLSLVPRDVLVNHVFADFAPIELLICSRVCRSWRTGFIESGLLPLPDRCELLDSIQVLVRSVSLLKWARSNARSWMEGERLQQIMILAAAEGRLDTLRWLSSEGYRIHSKCVSDLVFAAASGAHQETLEWLWVVDNMRSLAIPESFKGTPEFNSDEYDEYDECISLDHWRDIWFIVAVQGSGSSGNIEFAVWVRNFAASVGHTIDLHLEEDCLVRAIHEKHVHFIKWRRGMFEKFNDQTRRTLCWEAAREGSVEILTFLLEECRWNTVVDDYGDLYRSAIFYKPDVDHQPILSYLYEKGHGFDSRATVAAAFVGNLDTLEWLRARGCPWNSNVVENAAEEGHLHILEYALDHGCDGGAWVFCYAARGGQIRVMEWAMARGLEWDERTCFSAAKRGHLDALKWLRARGCPWDRWTRVYAERGRHTELLQWAIDNGAPPPG